MNEFEVKLHMLISSLEKKKAALIAILNITENQLLLLNDKSNPAMGAMFNEMNTVKQENIDMVIELDKLFQNMFEGVSAGFEEVAAPFKDRVAYMQQLIKEILELDVKIRAAEQSNKAIVSEMKKPAAANRGEALKGGLLKKYEKNKKP